jgi:hypothetical protein
LTVYGIIIAGGEKVKRLLLFLSLLVLLAGCTPVNGYNVGDIFASYDANQSVVSHGEMQIAFDDVSWAKTKEEKALVSLIQDAKLAYEMKLKDQQNAEGSFTLATNKGNAVVHFQVKANQLQFHLGGTTGVFAMDAQPGLSEADRQALIKMQDKWVKLLFNYLVKVVPNLDSLDVKTEGDRKIITYEMNGTDLLAMVKGTLENIKANPDEFKTFVEQAITLVKDSGLSVLKDLDMESALTDESNNKIAEQALEGIQQALDFWPTLEQMINSDPNTKTLLESNRLKETWTVDNKNRIIGEDLELRIELPKDLTGTEKPFGFTLKANSENQYDTDVTLSDFSQYGQTIEVNEENADYVFPYWLTNEKFYNDSPLKQFLEDKGVFNQEIRLPIGKKSVTVNGEEQPLDTPAILENGKSYVPLYFVSDHLYVPLKWDNDARTVTIDVPDGIKMVLKVDRSDAQVNGQTVKLEAPAIIRQDRVYVPISFVAEQMGIQVSWDSDANEVILKK